MGGGHAKKGEEMGPKVMEITLNGKTHAADGTETVAELLERLEVRGKRVAVMINDSIVRKDAYGATRIAPGDRVEVIHMVGGG